MLRIKSASWARVVVKAEELVERGVWEGVRRGVSIERVRIVECRVGRERRVRRREVRS